MPLLSVIVPVYNSERFLDKCVGSILRQTRRDFELLLIDDGSTDASPRLCDGYAAKDARVRVLHQKNGGVSSARNLGLEQATGEWLWFVDSDDFIDDDAIVAVLSDIERRQRNLGLYVFGSRGFSGLYEGELEDFLKYFHYTYVSRFEVWNKVYRASIARKCRFDTGFSIGEDLLFNIQYYVNLFAAGNSGGGFFASEKFYVHVRNPRSLMSQNGGGRLERHLALYDAIRRSHGGVMSHETLAYLFMMHLVTGMHDGMAFEDFSRRISGRYRDELRHSLKQLPLLCHNEASSFLGRMRIAICISLLCFGMYRLAFLARTI